MKIIIHWVNGDTHKFKLVPPGEDSAIETLQNALKYKGTITTIRDGKMTYHFNTEYIRLMEIEND
jgi:hypothetical protein